MHDLHAEECSSDLSCCYRKRSIFGLPILKPTSKVIGIVMCTLHCRLAATIQLAQCTVPIACMFTYHREFYVLHTRAQLWTSLQVSVWQGIVISLLDGTYSAFLVPISIAFSSDLNHWSWTTIVDVVAGNISYFILKPPILLCHLSYFVLHCTAQHASSHSLNITHACTEHAVTNKLCYLHTQELCFTHAGNQPSTQSVMCLHQQFAMPGALLQLALVLPLGPHSAS